MQIEYAIIRKKFHIKSWSIYTPIYTNLCTFVFSKISFSILIHAATQYLKVFYVKKPYLFFIVSFGLFVINR